MFTEDAKSKGFEAFAALNKQAESQACCGGLGGVGMQNQRAARPLLVERVEKQLNQQLEDVGRLSRLQELDYLLKKNPDVARILDLVEEVRR